MDNNEIKYCVSKLRAISNTNEPSNRQFINQILDELNLINTITASLDEKFSFIRVCCSVIGPSDSMLIGKCSQVITKFIQYEKLTDPMVSFIIEWCLLLLAESPDIAQIEILAVLELIFVGNVNSCKRFIDGALRILKDPIENKSKLVNPDEMLLQRLNCIRAIIPLMNNSHFPIVKDVLVQLTQNSLVHESSVRSKVILVQLEILLKLGEKSTSWLSENIGVVLGISLAYSSYGLPHHVQSIPLYFLPTSVNFNQITPKTSKSSKKRRKQKKNVIEKIESAPLDEVVFQDVLNWSQTSESDFSDSEMGRQSFLKKSERKIRLSSLSLLLFVIRTVDKKEIIGYWNNILSGPYSILKTVLADTSPRSRVAITSILSILFSSCKMYLSQALYCPKSDTLSYVSWSQQLADLITSTHEVLCDVITQPQSIRAVLPILQCLNIFLRNTPYYHLKDGILKKIVQSINPFLKHADCNVRIATIKCMNEIVCFEPITEEQTILICFSDVVEFSAGTTGSWIKSYCLESIKNEKLGVTVRAECWSLLGNLIKHHFMAIGCCQPLTEILEILQRDLQDNNIVIQQKAAKAFEQIAVPLSSLGDAKLSVRTGCVVPSPQTHNICDTSGGIDVYTVWLSMLQGPLVPMLQSVSGILASSAADCIANISAPVFEKLPEKLRIFVMTALCGCVDHEEHIARSAAVRALGTIVVFPFLSENIQIIYDVSDRIVSAMKDDNLSVRANAAWALGNLSDVLLSGREIGVPVEEIPLLNVLEQAVQTGNDHEKVKACSMRAIGNLLLLIEERHLLIHRFKTLVVDAAATLTYNASHENNMKVRWNACYALKNMLKNTSLITHISYNWVISVLDTLFKLIPFCTNFKVRQAAANALCGLNCREFYGDRYRQIWSVLIKAFENSQNLQKFSEFKHQRNLIDQLCFTLCHICKLLKVEDIDDELFSLISSSTDSLVKYITELKRRSLDSEEQFKQSVELLENLLTSNLGRKQLETVNILIEILNAGDASNISEANATSLNVEDSCDF